MGNAMGSAMGSAMDSKKIMLALRDMMGVNALRTALFSNFFIV